MKILLACERSGGHIFPAITMAKKIQSRFGQDCKVCFFLTANFLKSTVTKQGYEVFGRVFHRRFLLVEMIYRFFEAIGLLFSLRPARVIGFGGRDSFFLVFLAPLFGAKTAIYEPNVEFGKANRFLVPFVNRVYTGFEHKDLEEKKHVNIGIPLRDNLRIIAKDEARKHFGLPLKSKVILCFGGSQGSIFLNEAMKKLAARLPQDYSCLHFTGSGDYSGVSQFYKGIKNISFVRDFCPDMAEAYSAADIAICRCGASTVAEIAHFRLPAVFVPHPAASGHQRANALRLVDRGAARILMQSEYTPDKLYSIVDEMMSGSGLHAEMVNKMSQLRLGVVFDEFCSNVDF